MSPGSSCACSSARGACFCPGCRFSSACARRGCALVPGSASFAGNLVCRIRAWPRSEMASSARIHPANSSSEPRKRSKARRRNASSSQWRATTRSWRKAKGRRMARYSTLAMLRLTVKRFILICFLRWLMQRLPRPSGARRVRRHRRAGLRLPGPARRPVPPLRCWPAPPRSMGIGHGQTSSPHRIRSRRRCARSQTPAMAGLPPRARRVCPRPSAANVRASTRQARRATGAPVPSSALANSGIARPAPGGIADLLAGGQVSSPGLAGITRLRRGRYARGGVAV